MFEWNFGDILDAVSAVLPQNAPALIHGDRVITQAAFAARTNALARSLVARGARPGAKIAFYMHNCPEYTELLAACFKARLTHVNVNYRYTPDEVHYIFDNSDAEVVVFGAELRRHIEAIRPRLGKVRTFVEVGPGGDFAEPFEALCVGDPAPLGIERSPQDMLFLYTGGTTGMPKGVMWTQNDLRQLTLAAARAVAPVAETLDELVASVRAAGPPSASVIGPPLMHGTGLFTAMSAILAGGAVITLPSLRFDPLEMIEATARWRAGAWTIVGDPFARPLAEALDAEPGRWDVSCVERVTSSLMTAAGETPTAKFALGERARVFDENDRPVAPGSGVRGMVAVGPPHPLGYYKDPEKTARTFKVIDGVKYSIPGDWCVVEADGTLTLLGRGAACINTGGEKVFPEEVEEALKTHPAVEDALVIGLPDPKWGQSVTGVVRLRDGREFDEAALIAHVRVRLAAYKAPKRILGGDVALRAPNGKADYRSAADFAARTLSSPNL
jgi:fatty-acyl-CoA synthase